MLQELKKQSLKRVLPGVIVLALLAVCMALGGAGVVNLVKGPDWLYDYYGEDLEGRYVEADVYVVYDWYAETTSRREGSSAETTKSRDFIIDANDLEYIALEVPAADLKRVEQQMYDSWDYLDDVTDDLTTYYHIEGTVERMDAETLGLYTEFFWPTAARWTKLSCLTSSNRARWAARTKPSPCSCAWRPWPCSCGWRCC